MGLFKLKSEFELPGDQPIALVTLVNGQNDKPLKALIQMKIIVKTIDKLISKKENKMTV